MKTLTSGQWKPGDVAWANVVNGCEHRGAVGKERPVVVIEASQFGHLIVAGLTSKRVARNGAVRVALRNTEGWRLRGRPYIWSERLTRVSRHDLFEPIGHVSADDANTIGKCCGLESGWET